MSGDGIPEAASENPVRRGRGRPRKFGAELRELNEKLSRAGSERGLSNHAYASIAIEAITERCNSSPRGHDAAWDEVSWVMHEMALSFNVPQLSASAFMAGPSLAKLSVLTELGRILLSLGVRHFAYALDELCAMNPKPSVKKAVAMLRRWRLDGLGKATKRTAGDAKGLAKAIAEAIDAYLAKNPATPHETVIEALEWIIGLQFDSEEAPEP